MNIEHINARQILDSRGAPTLEAEVWCQGGYGRAAVPSGASTGIHEAHELRDGGSEFAGKGVVKALAHINGEIKDAVRGIPVDDQYRIDDTLIALDGTDNKSRLGANSILAVSLAAAHAAASARHLALWQHLNDVAHNPTPSLPLPQFNVLNGGSHAANAADFQEYMLVPTKAMNYRQAVQIVVEIFIALKSLLTEKQLPTTVGDEGGFAPYAEHNRQMLDYLMEATQAAGYEPGTDVGFALDVAASEFFSEGRYRLTREAKDLDTAEMIRYLTQITEQYPVVSIEDGLHEDDWDGWQRLTTTLPAMQLVGDDLLVTNQSRLETAIAKKAGNAILIKPNQIGTLTETIRTIAAAHAAGWRTIVSHRSGETEDVTIAHLAVGTGAGQIKTGSVSRGERTAKHNELMRIEDQNQHLTLFHPF